MNTTKAGRINDFIYDPAYIVSGQKDYDKLATIAKISTAKYAVCPIFPSMFSDLRNYPRKQYVVRKPAPIPLYIDKLQERNLAPTAKVMVLGQDRHKYFHNSVKQSSVHVPTLDISCFYDVDEERRQDELKAKAKGKFKNAMVQTHYRESSAQTSPWQPDYKVVQGDPELLKLDFLKWGSGLPVGMHEVVIIERMRMKQKWQESMPPLVDQKSFNDRRTIIEAVEMNEWAFREQEIQDVQDLRLELLEKMLNEMHMYSSCRTEKKMRFFLDLKLKEKREKLEALKKNSTREKRRLEFNYKGILSRYGPVNVFDEHADYKSELYIPLIRHGNNPKYGHQVINDAYDKYKSQYYGVEHFSTQPRNLKKSITLKNLRLPGARLCIRETKWTGPVLKKLHSELKDLRTTDKRHANLRVRIEHELSRQLTPEISDRGDDEAEAQYQSAVYLQKIMRGRAVQLTIFEGRDRCRELIDELRTNFALLDRDLAKQRREKDRIMEQQLDANCSLQNINYLEASLKKIGGYVTGSLLEFLNKELNRLLEERKIHAMVLCVERERTRREAAEAGRRQQEIRRRQEHDEIFKQVVKVHQDTVDLYLQDIVSEGLNFASQTEAREYVNNLAKKIDAESEQTNQNIKDVLVKEEYISNLIHHFVLPEVEKSIIRQRVKQNQKKYLKSAHDEIYENMDRLRPPPKVKVVKTMQERITKKLLNEEALRKAQMEEKRLVLADVQDILNELITTPVKMSAMQKVRSCAPHDVDDMMRDISVAGESTPPSDDVL